MRFSLIDLLIALAVEVLSLVIVAWTAYWMGLAPLSHGTKLWYVLAGLGLFVPLYLLITPPIYRRFGFFPLFLPKCPHCKRRHGYRFLNGLPPRLRVACIVCNRTFELWLESPGGAEVSKEVPSLMWSWPQSIGRWRIISRDEAG